MSKSTTRRGGPPVADWPDESELLSDSEYLQTLREGLTTLRSECRSRSPGTTDPELLARMVRLYNLWDFGGWAKTNPIPLAFEAFTVDRIGHLCTLLLRKEGLEPDFN
jgi:hypothetical protein